MMGLDTGLVRRPRIKAVRQTEVAECGLASLAMILNHYGSDIDLAALRRRFPLSSRGTTMTSLLQVADRLDLISRALKLPLGRLDKLSLPAILHWDFNHFVVLSSIDRRRALIHDPAQGTRWMTFDDVSDHFTGVAIELKPSTDFVPTFERRRVRIGQLWSSLTGLKRAILQTIILSVVLQAFVLASPYYMQVALDSALPALDGNLLTVLAIGFGVFTLINAGATLLRGMVLLSAGTALGYGIATNVGRRLLRLPVGWFENRHVGDVLSRFQSIGPLRQFLTEGAVGGTLDGLLAILTVAVMLLYSPTLSAVALVAFLLYLAIRYASFAAQREAQENAIAASGREQSMMIETIRGIVTLRLFNRETLRHAMWQSRLTDAVNAQLSLGRIGVWQTAASTMIFGLEIILSVWLGVQMLMNGGFSAGMLFAFFAYKTQFLQRASSLIDQLILFRMLGLHLDRLSDIALAEQDASFVEAEHQGSFSGGLELADISFRYDSADPWVLRHLNLSVAPGEHIAITGVSGGGKSTLVKIILGLLPPTKGRVLVEGTPLEQFGYQAYHNHISAVLQDDHLFAGSLSSNIALFDDTPNEALIQQAAMAVSLHDDIMRMPMRYETLVGDMGSSLSGGQRQRVLLARCLYRRPRLLVLDEATSHLDPATEAAVTSAIDSMGITRIIIAHRKETIVAAKRVFVLRDGSLVDDTLNEIS